MKLLGRLHKPGGLRKGIADHKQSSPQTKFVQGSGGSLLGDERIRALYTSSMFSSSSSTLALSSLSDSNRMFGRAISSASCWFAPPVHRIPEGVPETDRPAVDDLVERSILLQAGGLRRNGTPLHGLLPSPSTPGTPGTFSTASAILSHAFSSPINRFTYGASLKGSGRSVLTFPLASTSFRDQRCHLARWILVKGRN